MRRCIPRSPSLGDRADHKLLRDAIDEPRYLNTVSERMCIEGNTRRIIKLFLEYSRYLDEVPPEIVRNCFGIVGELRSPRPLGTCLVAPHPIHIRQLWISVLQRNRRRRPAILA